MKKKIILITALLLIVLVLSLLIASVFSLARSEPENFVGGGSSSGGGSGGNVDGSGNSGSSVSPPVEVVPDATSFVFTIDGEEYIADCTKNYIISDPGVKEVTIYNQTDGSTEKYSGVTVCDDFIYFDPKCQGYTDRFQVGVVPCFGGFEYAFFYKVYGEDTYHLIDGKDNFKVSLDGKDSDGFPIENFGISGVFQGMELVHFSDDIKVYLSDSNYETEALPEVFSLYLFVISY